MNPKKIFVVGYAKWYPEWIKDCVIVDDITDADIVFFTGGEDVAPQLYGAECHPTTGYNLQRDEYEIKVFNSVSPDQLVIGVCRGSQFCCVMNGGKLVQNCHNHAIGATHKIVQSHDFITNGAAKEIEITSTHHQMQYPYNLKDEDYTLMYVSKEHRSDVYEGDGIDPEPIKEFGEPEIVLYHVEGKPQCLAIQGHPEMMERDHPTVAALNKIVDTLLIKNNNA